jgi:hypothetical protein
LLWHWAQYLIGRRARQSVSNQIEVRRNAMKKPYGELMGHLLRYQGRYPHEEEFRAFLRESVRTLARDLKEFDIELSLIPESKAAQSANQDRNVLKIGCE